MKVETIKRFNISDEVSRQIQNLILDGKIKPGEKLPSERELCNSFNISRTSIREALSGLISTGFLEKKSDGTYVNKDLTEIVQKPMYILLTSNEITLSEIYEARSILEIQNARLAAKKATDDDLNQMEECIKIMNNPNSSLENIMEYSVEFHNIIARATKNKILTDIYRVIYGILQNMRNQSELVSNITNSTSFHINIFEAIKARDEEKAGKIMHDHIIYLFNKSKTK